MRPYTINVRTGQRITIDLDHLVAIEGPFMNSTGASFNLHFLFRDTPLNVFNGYYTESEEEFTPQGCKLRMADGRLVDHHHPDALKSLAANNVKHTVIELLEKSWIEG